MVAFGGYDGSIRIKALMDNSQFNRGVLSMGNSIKALQASLMKLAGAVGLAFGVVALVNFGRESVKLASDIQEVQNVIDVTFGQGAVQIEEFAKTAAEAFGLSELSAKQYTGTMGAMLKSSGLTTSAAQEMAIALAGLSGDLASFYNLDTDEAFEKIRSGISGETEPLKQLGINMSVANLEAYALSQGITKSYNAMSQAEQVLLRYNYLLSVTADAQGDFARTSGSFANQVRILQLNFEQLKISVGNAILPIAQAVLPGINAIISALTKLAAVFAKVTALLFGKPASGVSVQVSAQKEIASSGISAADATDQLAKSTSGAGKAAKSAAKDMKGILANFDELNILANKASDSLGGAGGAAGSGAGDIEIPELGELNGGPIEEIGEAFSSLGERFKAALDEILAGIPKFRNVLLDFAASFNDFNQKLYDAFTFPGVKERVQLLGRELAGAFNDLVNAIDWHLWGQRLGAGLNLGLQFLVNFLYTFDWVNFGQKLADLINGAVSEIDWYSVGKLLWFGFKYAIETLAGLLMNLDTAQLAKAASQIAMGFFDSIVETLESIDWKRIGENVRTFLVNIDWLGVMTSVSAAIAAALQASSDFFSGLLGEEVRNVIRDLMLELSKGLLVLGAILAISGANIPLGLNLMAKGALALGAASALDWTYVSGNVEKIVGEIGAKVGAALLASGAVLAFSGIDVPKGIALMALGAASLAAAAAVNWDTIVTALQGPIGVLTALLSGSLLALGAVLCFSGAFIPLGLGLMAAGAAGLAVATAANWDTIINALRGPIGAITALVGGAFLVLGAVLCFTGAGIPLGLGLIVAGAAGLAVAIAPNWESLQPKIQSVVSVITAISSAAALALGVILLFTGAGIPLGLGLIAAGAAGLAATIVPNWDFIRDAVANAFENLKSWWSQNASKYFTMEYWENKARSAVDGLLKGLRSIWNDLSSWASGVKRTIEDAFSGASRSSAMLTKRSRSSYEDTYRISSVAESAAYSTRSLPRLANGAVIPPNQQFAAILGDQRSGVNIEAPLSTIEQALQNVLSRNGGLGSGGNLTVIMEIDGREFGRASYKYGSAERQRVGVRLTEVRT